MLVHEPVVLLYGTVGLLVAVLSWWLCRFRSDCACLRYWTTFWAATVCSSLYAAVIWPAGPPRSPVPQLTASVLLILLAALPALMAMAAVSLFECRFPWRLPWTGMLVFAAALSAGLLAVVIAGPAFPLAPGVPLHAMTAAATFAFAAACYRFSARAGAPDRLSTAALAAYAAHHVFSSLAAAGIGVYTPAGHGLPISMAAGAALGCLVAASLWFHALREMEADRRRSETLWLEARDGVLILSRSGIVLQANPAYCRTFQKDLTQVQNCVAWAPFAPSHTDRVASSILTGLETHTSGNPLSIQAQLWNGREIWLEYSFSPIPGGDTVFAIVRDATERISARRSYAEMVTRTPIGIHFYSLDSARGLVFTGANEAADAILGIRHAALLDKEIEDAFPSLRGTPIPAAYRAVLESGKPYRRDEVLYSGATISGAFEVLCFQLRPGSIAVMFQDITERKRVEDALRASEARYRLITDNSTDMISVHDAEGVYLFVSPACKALFGYEADDMVGRSAYEFFHPEDLAAIRATHRAVNLGQSQSVTYRFRRAGGPWLWVESFTKPVVVDHPQTPMQIIAVTRNVTERRSLEEQFHLAQRLDSIGRLAGGIAHDFNNLLTVINGNASLIESDPGASPRSRDLARAIIHAGDRAAALTRHLLAFARRQRLEPVVLDLNLAVLDARSILQEIAGAQIRLSLDLDPSPARILADPTQINQVLLNLTVNARDAMQGSGTISIATRRLTPPPGASIHPDLSAGDCVSLSFSDTGQGMSVDVREKIFEPFFTTKEKGKGSGLGLSTVFGIVKQSNGHIVVHSQPGEGAEFRLYFPLISETASAGPPGPQPDPPARPPVILLAVSEPDIATYVRALLEMNDHRVTEAVDEPSLFRALTAPGAAIRIVIGDTGRAGALASRLLPRLRHEHPQVHLILLSPAGEPVTSSDPYVAFVTKPFAPATLLAHVTARLD